jgi:hypothetical protein
LEVAQGTEVSSTGRQILEGLNESCTHEDQKQWQREIDEIVEKRIADPDIMDDFLSSVETGTVKILLCLSLFLNLDVQSHRELKLSS